MRYRVSICENVLGTKFFCVEQKTWILGSWKQVSYSMTRELKEAIALKCLKQKDRHQSGLDFYKPSHRCSFLKIEIK